MGLVLQIDRTNLFIFLPVDIRHLPPHLVHVPVVVGQQVGRLAKVPRLHRHHLHSELGKLHPVQIAVLTKSGGSLPTNDPSLPGHGGPPLDGGLGGGVDAEAGGGEAGRHAAHTDHPASAGLAEGQGLD